MSFNETLFKVARDHALRMMDVLLPSLADNITHCRPPESALRRAERHFKAARQSIENAFASVLLPDSCLCPKCKAEIEDICDRFCRHCAQDLQPMMHHCECGFALNSDMALALGREINFCPACGRPASSFSKAQA